MVVVLPVGWSFFFVEGEELGDGDIDGVITSDGMAVLVLVGVGKELGDGDNDVVITSVGMVVLVVVGVRVVDPM